MFWAIACDTAYAMIDRDDDCRIGIKSSTILFGCYHVAGVMTAHALSPGLMALIGWWQMRDVLYFASPVSGLGSKMGIDATNKWPVETSRERGTPIAMSEEVRQRVDEMWGTLGI